MDLISFEKTKTRSFMANVMNGGQKKYFVNLGELFQIDSPFWAFCNLPVIISKW